MKIISIVLTVLLFIPLAHFLFVTGQGYLQADTDFAPTNLFASIPKSFIICGIVYLAILIVSIVLNVKRKYFINIVSSAVLIIIIFLFVFVIGFDWLG